MLVLAFSLSLLAGCSSIQSTPSVGIASTGAVATPVSTDIYASNLADAYTDFEMEAELARKQQHETQQVMALERQREAEITLERQRQIEADIALTLRL